VAGYCARGYATRMGGELFGGMISNSAVHEATESYNNQLDAFVGVLILEPGLPASCGQLIVVVVKWSEHRVPTVTG